MVSLRQLVGWQASSATPYARPRSGLLAALAVLVPLLAACDSESLIPPSAENPSEVYWGLELNHHAVTLSTTAPYDTVTLVATPRNVRNEPLPGLPRPTYVSPEPELVLVTPEGRLVAVAPMAPGTQIVITATLTVGNLSHQDSVWVTVVDGPPSSMLGDLSAEPILPDSAKISAKPTRVGNWAVFDTLPARATDVTGAPMEGLLMSFRSSDTTRLLLRRDINGSVEGILPGTADVYVSATVFGVHRADTVTYRIGYPLWSMIHIRPLPEDSSQVVVNQREVRIAAGGVVFFTASAIDTSVQFDIRFDDPERVTAFNTAPVYATPPNIGVPFACSINYIECGKGGNVMFDETFPSIAISGGYYQAARAFLDPGTYGFQSSAGFSGRIIVVDEE